MLAFEVGEKKRENLEAKTKLPSSKYVVDRSNSKITSLFK